MNALTFYRPWPTVILHCPTFPMRVENRPWKPWASVIGKMIALHAGAKYDRGAASELRAKGYQIPGPDQSPLGIVGVARVDGWVEGWRRKLTAYGGVTRERAQEAVESRWFFGPFGWVLDDVRALPEPIPWRGMYGLWAVPDEVEAEIWRRLRGEPPRHVEQRKRERAEAERPAQMSLFGERKDEACPAKNQANTLP